MASSKALKQSNLELFKHELNELVSSAKSNSENDPRPELVELQHNEEAIGLVEIEALRELVLLYEEESTDLTIKRPNEESFLSLFEHPLFQRRRPQLVAQDTLTVESETYFVLKKGSTLGPYSKQELIDEVKKAHVIPTDLISNDEGQTWSKLYHYQEFDRRIYTQTQLPSGPDIDQLPSAQKKGSSIEESEKEAITGLAFLGNLQRGKGHDIIKKSYAGDATDPNRQVPKASQDPFQFFWVALFFLSLAGLLMVVITWKTPSGDQVASERLESIEAAQQAARAPANAPVIEGTPLPTNRNQPTRINQRPQAQQQAQESIETPRNRQVQERIQSAQARRLQRAESRPRSLSESQGFRDAMAREDRQDDLYADDSYYDDASDPYEQDPVRSRISRGTVNPDDDHDNWAEGLMRSPASADPYDDPYAEEPLDLFDDY